MLLGILFVMPASPLSLGEGGGRGLSLFNHFIQIQDEDAFGTNLLEALYLVP